MWWKILLYSLLVLVLGVGVTTLSGSIAFNTLASNLVSEAVAAKDYTLAESFFTYVNASRDWKFASLTKNETRVEVYPCLVKQPYYYYLGEARYSMKYEIVEEAIAVSFYHLPKGISYEDGEEKAQVSLSFSGGGQYPIYLHNDSEDETAANFHIDFSSYIPQYKGLTVYVTYHDFIAHGGALETDISALSLQNGKGEEVLSVDLPKAANFRSSFSNIYRSACEEYRDFMLEYGEYNSVTGLRRKKELLAAIDSVTKQNKGTCIARPSTSIVLGDTRFILAISIALASYISIAVVVTRVIFFKKKQMA